MKPKEPTRILLFQYGFIALPLAFAGLPLYIHAPDFYTRDLGMSIGLIGAILLAVRLFDAVQDPVIGYISDKYTAQRFKIILGGAVALTAGLAAVFYGPQFGVPIAAWFAAAMILATTGFSIVVINLNMIGGFWQDDKNQRTRISAWREAFMLAGLLIAAIVPEALQKIYGAETAFEGVFWIYAVIMALAFLLFTRFMNRIKNEASFNATQTATGFSFLKIAFGPDKVFFTACFLTHLAASLPGVLVLFFINDYLQAPGLAGVFLFLYFISGAALIGLWVKLSEKFGKEKTWLASMILAIVTFAGAFFLQSGDVIGFGIICVLSGLALGADLALPPSILADRVSEQNTQSDATQYYALLAFIPKTALALASGIAFLILDQFSFQPGSGNSEQALLTLITLYALIPCVIKLASAGLVWRLIKQEGDLNEIVSERSITHGPTHIS